MPAVNELLEDDKDYRRVEGLADPDPEDIQLYLPSGCPTDITVSSSLRAKEAALRRGQCSDSIALICARLIAQRHLISFRNAWVRGQDGTTRAARLLATIAEKLKEAEKRYVVYHAALLALVGEKECLPFRPLGPKDTELPSMAESDVHSVKKLGRANGRESRVTGSQSKSTMSWIWTATDEVLSEDDALREGTI